MQEIQPSMFAAMWVTNQSAQLLVQYEHFVCIKFISFSPVTKVEKNPKGIQLDFAWLQR